MKEEQTFIRDNSECKENRKIHKKVNYNVNNGEKEDEREEK